MKLRRTRIDGSTDVRITTPQGEDFGRVENGTILYPDAEALKVVQAVNSRERIDRELADLQRELASYKQSPESLKPLDLRALTRYSDEVFTHIAFDDCRLRDRLVQKTEDRITYLNWLDFGLCEIRNESNTCFLGARMRDGITDFEHDSCYALRIDLVGLKFKYVHAHATVLEAWISPDPDDILIHSPDFIPEDIEDAGPCPHCKGSEKHLMLPGGHFVPPRYDLARVVAGKRISIHLGKRWKEDEDA